MYLSLETARKLKEWGCDVEGGIKSDLNDYKIYDLRDIITNGEMAKAFFGELYWQRETDKDAQYYPMNKVENLNSLLHQNKQEKAEEYLLEHTIFNPKNK